ncbi:MAG: Crp/Fnr family transcriptional regulator [Bacteroidia bacterium]|nr:Crp/Fnr family transcriptional regulator [Bacteroidia bacterium]
MILASELFTHKSFKKNDNILKPGSNSKNIYFLISGLVYSQSIDEKINWYEFEGQSFADIESVFFNKKCEQYIRCAENSQVVYITKNDLLELVNTNHNWSIWYVSFLEEIIQRLYFYYQNLLVKDASQRYSELMGLHPEILQRIPLGHISSYLGISQVSLSRIRAGKQKKKA